MTKDTIPSLIDYDGPAGMSHEGHRFFANVILVVNAMFEDMRRHGIPPHETAHIIMRCVTIVEMQHILHPVKDVEETPPDNTVMSA